MKEQRDKNKEYNPKLDLNEHNNYYKPEISKKERNKDCWKNKLDHKKQSSRM